MIRPVALDDPAALALIAELNRELLALYPEEGATHFRLDTDEVAEGRGAFMVAFDGEEPVACGAVRLIASDTAEVKRMYTRPSVRGRGLAGAVLAALEVEALRLGATTLVLETGVRQLEAIALYRRYGFEVIESFGEYVDSPISLCMAKRIG